MNCREYIIEFEERGDLSEPARLHLTVCADCRKTSARQTQIWLLIDDFQPVAAPTDFDFYVRARIAKTKPSDFRKPSFLPILRYVLPLSLAVLLLGIFVFNAGYFSGAPTDFAGKSVEVPAVNNDLPINAAFANQMAFAPSDTNKMVVEPPMIDQESLVSNNVPKPSKDNRNARIETADLNLSRSPKVKNSSETYGGSRDIAVTPIVPILPPGFNANANAADAPKIESSRPADEKETLSFIGIEFVLKNGRRTITAVQENSMAARSGVKVGDVVEKISGNALTIQRGTERLEITLR